MKIEHKFKTKKKIFSLEFFPPKTTQGEENLYRAVEELKILSPDFVSVTYGAMGSTQDKSLSLIEKMHNTLGLEVMPHFTCIGATEEKVESFLRYLQKMNVENILALRGDAPEGTNTETGFSQSKFRYAIDLVKYIKARDNHFSIGVAGYPEGHLECPSLEEDLIHLKEKVEAGAAFIITQLFFNNELFLRFRDRAQKVGIAVPIIPGIMPLIHFKQIEKITSMCGATISKSLTAYFSRDDISNADKLRFGIEFSVTQCQELMDEGVPGLHFYTMNRSQAILEICEQLSI